jgi:uncharacterized protein YodC (DUF2158 family)
MHALIPADAVKTGDTIVLDEDTSAMVACVWHDSAGKTTLALYDDDEVVELPPGAQVEVILQ